VSGDSGCCSNGGGDKVCATTAALTPFKVSVACAGGTFAWCQLVWVHCQTHAASWFTKVNTSGDEDLVKSFSDCLVSHGMTAGNNHCALYGDSATFEYSCCCPNIFDATIGA
jgi:hypothetical protein